MDILQSKLEWEMHVVTGEFMHLIELLRKMAESLQLLVLEKNSYVTWMETETKGRFIQQFYMHSLFILVKDLLMNF